MAKHNLYSRPVKELMSKDIVSIHYHETVHDALHLMVENRRSALPVIDGHGHCVGILSTSDLVDLTLEVEDEVTDVGRGAVSSRWLFDQLAEGLGRQRVEEVMTTKITAVGPETPLVDATRVMLEHHVHRMPVVGDNGQLLGILSTMDILRALAESAPQ
jgi:CBS domain-containing protein